MKSLDPDFLMMFDTFFPHWVAVLVGPEPEEGSGKPLVATLALLGDHEQASRGAWVGLQRICSLNDIPFAEDEWRLERLQIVNGN